MYNINSIPSVRADSSSQRAWRDAPLPAINMSSHTVVRQNEYVPVRTHCWMIGNHTYHGCVFWHYSTSDGRERNCTPVYNTVCTSLVQKQTASSSKCMLSAYMCFSRGQVPGANKYMPPYTYTDRAGTLSTYQKGTNNCRAKMSLI